MTYTDKFSYTPQSLTKNNASWFPIMGELHYTRTPEKFWKESLLKMKAGGVTIVSSYAIWIHHEEIEGEWDFEGQRNLREFTKLVSETGLYFILRIGPWCHGEIRNGGFPDWLLKKDFPLRANNPSYFAEVKKYYQKIFEQVKGFLLKDKGPIIGIQIENEFGHCGGLKGSEGEEHMLTLQNMAKDVGFDVPLYTATGWGGATTGGMIPVMGGYVDSPWDQRPCEIEPSGNFVITPERNDHNIGSDFGFGAGITFDITKFPYLTAELGGGLEPTFLRRTVPLAQDIGAETLVKLASGVSLLGYYMYHGGTNPYGKLSTMQESKVTGSLNDLPELSYDFFAPIGEYGKISSVYGELKLFALFVSDFGSDLCKMDTIFLKDSPLDPANKTDVRYSFRIMAGRQNQDGMQKKCGYLFVNNYVRHQTQAEHKAKVFQVPQTNISFLPLNIKNGDYYFLPFNMEIGDGIIRTALASPLCVLRGAQQTFVFYKTSACNEFGDNEIFDYEKNPTNAHVLLLTRNEALASYKISRDSKDYLIITNSALIDDGLSLQFFGNKTQDFYSYPALPKTPQGFTCSKEARGLSHYVASNTSLDICEPKTISVKVTPSEKSAQGKSFYNISLESQNDITAFFNSATESIPTFSDAILSLHYNGNYARLYEISNQQKLIADNLFCGKDIAWKIGLKWLCAKMGITKSSNLQKFEFLLEIQELKKETPVYLTDFPIFKDGVACNFVSAEIQNEYMVKIEI